MPTINASPDFDAWRKRQAEQFAEQFANQISSVVEVVPVLLPRHLGTAAARLRQVYGDDASELGRLLQNPPGWPPAVD